MDRLLSHMKIKTVIRPTCFVALAISTILGPRAAAQFSTMAPPPVQHISVVGDVALPQTYKFNPTDRVHVLDLLQSGRFGGLPGYAIILRGQPVHSVAVDQVYPSMKGKGALLHSGDVVVFRTQTENATTSPNALVLLGEVPSLLPLNNGLSMAALADLLQLPPGLAAPVTRSAAGTARTIRLEGTQPIQHGDVVDLNAALAGSDFASETYSLSPTVITDSRTQATTTASAILPFSQATDDSALPAALPPIEYEEPTAQMQLQTAEVQTTTEGGSPSFDLSITDSSIADLPNNHTSHQSTAGSSHSETFVHAASMQRTDHTESGGLQADQQVDRGQQTQAASSPVWNLTFIAGLLLAMVLIGVGWLKTNQEMENERRHAEDIAKRKSAEARTQLPVTADNSSTARPQEQTTEEAHNVDEDASILSIGLDEAGKPESQESWQDLEDLIQNKLPLELQQAKLPLKVALFGKPSGPQRLRIDAAHTSIAPPNFASSRKKDGNKRQMAATSSPASKKPAADSQTGSRPSTQSAAPRASRPDNSRLDRALNFLEEQTDS